MIILQQIVLFIGILLGVAFFSLMERKLMASVQIRIGPNKVGMGILQPFSDAVKLILKVESSPSSSVKAVYFASPMFFFFLCLIGWAAYSSEWIYFNFPSSMIFVLVCFSLTSYGVVFSGWFSNSKYATLGCGRALAQTISYEVGLSTVVVFICAYFSVSSLEFFFALQKEVLLVCPFFFVFMLFVLIVFAELNRSPFDLAEGESELVSGYSVEYGGLGYTVIFLGENLALLWSAYFLGVLFAEPIQWVFILVSVMVRAALPRFRFDKMMGLFWISVLPLILVFFVILFSISQVF